MKKEEMDLLYPHAGEIDKLIESGQYSQNGLAQAIGISSSQLSQYRRKIYHETGGKPETLSKKYKDWALLNAEQKEANFAKRLIIPLNVTAKIVQFIRISHRVQQNSMIWGPSGVGKSEAVDWYCRENSNAVKITGRPDAKSVKAFLQLTCKAFGIKNIKSMSSSDMFESIGDKVKKSSSLLLIIDEAHQFQHGAIQEARAISDEYGLTFCLVGTEAVHQRLRDPRDNIYLAEVSRRVVQRRQLILRPEAGDQLKKRERKEHLEDLTNLCAAYGTTDKEIIAYMDKKSAFGGIGIVSDILRWGKLLSETGKITMQEIKEASNFMELGIQ